MFVGITNTPRDYAWGSSGDIADLLGREPSGGPEAELWLGAHPESPSRILAPASTGGHEYLDVWITAEPDLALGADRTSDRLPFLLKLLAAEQPLSIQAHPSIEQARAGFAREEAAGIPISASERNYKDELHKPELVFALSECFDALAGFRAVGETRLLVSELIAVSAGDESAAGSLRALDERLAGEDPLRNCVEWALGGGEYVDATIAAVAHAAARKPESSSFTREYATLSDLADRYPGDPGILVALLLNRIALRRDEALYLPSGNMHAYLSGFAIEVMAASDNVLRGGLTPKHVDAEQLLSVVTWRSLPAPHLIPQDVGPGVTVFRPDVVDFALVRVVVGDHGSSRAQFPLPGPAIALVTSGEVRMDGASSTATLVRGESAFITPDEGELTFTGSGTVFIATTNV